MQDVGCIPGVTDKLASVVWWHGKQGHASRKEWSVAEEKPNQETPLAVMEKIAGRMRFEPGPGSGLP
jgi:hypothetical protein